MKCFIFKRQPKSYNAWKSNTKAQKDGYKFLLENSYRAFNTTPDLLLDDLYGVVYFFHKRETGTDADNISKPVWDCLEEFLYDDDKKIKLRIGGCFDLNENDYNILDITDIPTNVSIELINAFLDDNCDYIVYVECGKLYNNFYKFNLEINGD